MSAFEQTFYVLFESLWTLVLGENFNKRDITFFQNEHYECAILFYVELFITFKKSKSIKADSCSRYNFFLLSVWSKINFVEP
jgi:hypothetical protein